MAQNSGRITGVVTDKKTGETLIGLSVKIDGSSRGASTDVSGRYSLGGLADGRYTLVFSYVGFQSKKVSDIDVKGGKPVTLNVVMEEGGSTQLQQVVISVSARQESLSALYAKQKNSARVSDGISAEAIKKSPDRSAGEVLKRVSGTTVQDNKFIVVRGLSDRYNTATLDNAALPSTEPNRKAFSFDIVPSNMIDNIVVNKTGTPDLPGDFAGGAVQMSTTDIPEKDFISFGVGYGYNTVSTFKDFQYGQRNTSDYFGFANASRQLPSSNFPKNTRETISLTPDQNIAALKGMNSNWSINHMNALPTQNYQLSLGKLKIKDNGDKFGAIVAVTYRNAQSRIVDQDRSYFQYNYVDNPNTFSTNLGVLANLAYTHGKSKFTFKNIYNRTFEDKYTYRSGLNASSGTSGYDIQYYAFDLIQKGLFKSTLEGDHAFGENNAKINWNVAFSNVINNQPDQKKLTYQRDAGTTNPFSAGITNINKENNRFFADLDEKIYSGGVNLTLPVSWFREKDTFKAGLGTQYRQRDFTARLLGMVIQSSYPDAEEVRRRPIETIYDPALINQGAFRLEEISSGSDTYDANSLTSYAYAMLDNKLSDKLRVVWGVRAEQFNLQLNSTTVTNDPLHVKKDYLDILPSVNFTYGMTPKSNLRLAYYRTVARPEFRELAPFAYYDYEALGTVSGNANLKRTQIDNADIRFETYPGVGEIVSFSIFYKRFQNAIEPNVYDQNSTPDFSYYNAQPANNFGAEFELRKNLNFIKDNNFFTNTQLYTNVSVVKSEVKNPTDQNYVEKTRPMVGQSPYVINAGLTHTSTDKKLGLSILYNRIGRRINRAGGVRFSSIYENPRDVLDFQATYKVIKNKGEFKLNVSDILNNSYYMYFDRLDNPVVTSAIGNGVFNKYKMGTNVSLSFNYSF